MKYRYYLLLLFIVQLIACKKAEVIPNGNQYIFKEPDFALIPTKDAKWYVRIITDGSCFPDFDPLDVYIDTSKDLMYNLYYELSATGKTFKQDGYTYHIYEGVVTINDPYSSVRISKQPTGIWLREDTIGKKVYLYGSKTPMIDFSDVANQGVIRPFPTWPQMDIMSPDAYLLSGIKMKSWNMRNSMDNKLEYFYKAIGIGNATGIVPNDYGIGVGQPVSLAFVYKGDSIHFDYPLH